MRKGLAAAGVVALISVGSVACGADKPTTPQGKVSDAFTKLDKQSTVTLDLSIDGSADQIYASMKDEDGFTQADAKLLSSLHISVAASSKQQFSLLSKAKSTAGTSADLALTSEDVVGGNLLEVRTVGQKVYIRFDVKGLEKLDVDPSASDTKGIDEANQFIDKADQLPASLASVKAALKGQWVSIDPKAYEQFVQSMAGSLGGSSSTDSLSNFKLDATTQKQALAAIHAALTKNVTYKDAGSKDGADHVQVSVPAQQFAKDIATGLAPVVKQFPGVKESDLTDFENADGVPAKTVTADVAIKNGSLTSITFNLGQLDSGVVGSLPLTLGFTGSAKPISAPAGAQTLNPQDIMGFVMSAAGEGSSDDSSF
ncbi:hypothetical protein [Actinacidiphila yeochonensis]|uniref:hypothetical protein n=1 Tax=Actinacidiphila yeochonensis TaxID=89050 RepID=UPI00055D2C65|nr:hypothetical protein [Actinacidiphila yeochonensis]